MGRLRKSTKTETDPVAGRELGVKKPAKGGLLPASWVEDLYKEALKPSPYKSYLEFSVSSTTPTKFSTSSTTTIPTYLTSSSTGTYLPPSKSYFIDQRPRISFRDMKTLVDRLVKERYPAYEPQEHVEF